MDSPPQTVTVRGGDFLCGKSGRKPCGSWSCGEKEIGFVKERLVWKKNIVLIGIVSGSGCML